MKYLRKAIREIILEGFKEDFKELSDTEDYKSAKSYFTSGSGYPQTHYRPWSRSVKYRRNIKQLFQKNANVDELNEHLSCIHFLNYVPSSRTAEIPEQLEKFVSRYEPDTIQKHEISTVGYYHPSDRTPHGVGIILDKKYITFAFEGDAWTEETKTAFRNPQGREPFLVVDKSGKIIGAHLSKSIDFENTNWERISDVDEGIRTLWFRDPLDRVEGESMGEFIERVKEEADRKGIESIAREIPNQYRKRTNMEIYLKDVLVKRNPDYKIISFPEYYENSGIPKRPSMSIDPSEAVLNMDRFKDSDGNLIKNDQFSYLYEVVCDNWSYNTVYIHPDWIITDKMNDIIEQNNLNLVRSLP